MAVGPNDTFIVHISQNAGQFVGIRFPGEQDGTPRKLYNIASSPTKSREDSVNLDASIIEVTVERGSSADDDKLADLAPGAEVEVRRSPFRLQRYNLF